MTGRYGFVKRMLAWMLCIVVGFAAVSAFGIPNAYGAELKGVRKGHWATGALQRMVDAGILTGDKNGQLHPDRDVTRAEYVAMLNRAFQYTTYKDTSLPFRDITGKEWYADHIRTAYAQGYFAGLSANQAGATRSVTREEAAALLCRNLKLDKQLLQIDTFTDGRTIGEWSRGYIGAALEKGYIRGYANKTFRPKQNISRAEVATMLSNALGTILLEEGAYTHKFLSGNMTISSSGVELQDTTVAGDLYVKLKNVKVLGEVIVCGGGESDWGGNSIVLDDCTIQKLTVDGAEDKPVSLYAKGNTNVVNTNIKSDTFLENHADTIPGFDNIRVMGTQEIQLHLSGDFQKVQIVKPKNQVQLGKGSIKNLTVDEDATDSKITLDRNTLVKNLRTDGVCQVSGRGDIADLVVTTNGVRVEGLPDQIEIRPGITANIAGQTMNSLDAEESSSRPRILAGYPKTDELTSTATNMLFSANKPGTIYWALTYGDAKKLTEEEIMKPSTINAIKKKGKTTVAESEQELSTSLSGLEPNAQYTLSAVLVDTRGDISRIKEEVFRMADNTKPGFVSGYPRTVPRSSDSLDIEAAPTKDCTLYWAVFRKGSVAPTLYQLRSQDLNGQIAKGKRKKSEKNIEYRMTVTGLKENEVYDVYIMASDGENDSQIVKLSGTTKDTTPPEFIRDTPKGDKAADTSVDVRVAANEDATLYYVVCEWGTTFPIPIPPSVDQPSLDSDEAKNQVLTGNNAFKAGKANLKANTEATVKISGGLQAQTPYQLFMVLQDKAGNLSIVKKLDIKTRDVVPPTAKVAFDNAIGGKAKVEEPIRIVFSEIVWNSATMKELTQGTITEDIVKLYDITTGKAQKVTILYDKIAVQAGEHYETVLVFPPEAFQNADGGVGLNSGNRYQFELSNITDTSGNAMKNQTLLDAFETVPPLVELTETPTSGGMDYTFSVEPQSKKTSDLILFDMILESDTTIEFKLYKRTDPNAPCEELRGSVAYNPFVWENAATTLYYIIDKGMNDGRDYTFKKFNALEDYQEYGVKILKIDGDGERSGWNRVVNIKVKCVAGPYRQLSTLAADPVSNYATIVDKGMASDVNYSMQDLKNPKKFTMEIPFTDTLVPAFLEDYPHLKDDPNVEPEDAMITDVLIRPRFKTNRSAVLYYLIAPKGTIAVDATNQNELNKLALPIIANAYKDANIRWGTYKIESGNVIYQPTLPGTGELTPDKDYEAFFVLKSTPPEPSKVYYRAFKTTPIAPPKLEARVVAQGESTAQVQITSNKNARVDWIVLNRSDAVQYLKYDSKGKASVKDDKIAQVTTIIRNGNKNVLVTPHNYGSGVAKLNKAINEHELLVDVTRLQRENYYVLLAVARMELSNGQSVGKDSVIAVSEEFTAKDVTPPAIIGEDNRLPTEIGAKSAANAGGPYGGSVTIDFTEPLFYMPYEGAEAQPLTREVFEKEFVVQLQQGGTTFKVGSVKLQQVPTGKKDPSGSDITAGAVIGCRLEFQNATGGTTASVRMLLCDAGRNMMSPFRIAFHDEEDADNPTQSRKTSYWSYQYITLT